jgi:hypothetical protein
MDPIDITDSVSGPVIRVRVIPRATKTAVGGVRNRALLVRLAAPPVDDAANHALMGFLAALLDRPKRDIAIVAGHAARDKRVAIAGLTREQLAARLSDILRA